MIGHINPPAGSAPISETLLDKIELRLPARAGGMVNNLYLRQLELEQGIYDLLVVLHDTGKSKKSEADNGRRLLGMEPGEKLKTKARPS